MGNRKYRITQTPSGRYCLGMNGGDATTWYKVGNVDFDSLHEAERALVRVIRAEVIYYDAEGNIVE